MRRSHQPAVILAACIAWSTTLARADEVRFEGDLSQAWVRDVAATPDGGWGALFTVSGAPGQYEDALVVRADAVDSLSWALRIRGRAPGALASLPDGGLLLAGDRGWPGDRGWLARLTSDGSLLWQVELAPDEHVGALACNGWSCAVGNGLRTWPGFLIGIDALAGVVTYSHALPMGSSVTALAIRSDGLLAAGVRLYRGGDIPDAVVAVIDATGTPAWSTVLAASEEDTWREAPTVRRVAWLSDGALGAVGRDQDSDGRALVAAADGSPLALHLVGGGGVHDAVELSSGDLLMLVGDQRQVRASARLVPLQSVAISHPNDWTPGRLATSSTGDVLELFSRRLVRLRGDLTAPAACPSLVEGILPQGIPSGGVMVDAGFTLTVDAGPRVTPTSDVAEPTCLFSRCLIPCEQDCFNGVDDDEDGTTDCGDVNCSFTPGCEAADSDGDGLANDTDCRPDIGSAFAVPGPVLDVRVSRLRGVWVIPVLTWSDVRMAGSGTAVEIVRGRLRDLHADRSARRGSCVARESYYPSFIDGTAAEAAADLWYLVRAVNACGIGPWEEAGLDAGGTDCP